VGVGNVGEKQSLGSTVKEVGVKNEYKNAKKETNYWKPDGPLGTEGKAAKVEMPVRTRSSGGKYGAPRLEEMVGVQSR